MEDECKAYTCLDCVPGSGVWEAAAGQPRGAGGGDSDDSKLQHEAPNQQVKETIPSVSPWRLDIFTQSYRMTLLFADRHPWLSET